MNDNTDQRQPDAEAGTSGDPLVDEVRAIRKDLSDRFGNDVQRLAEYVRAVGEKHRRDHPRPAPPRPTSAR